MVSWKGLPVFSDSARTRSSARASRASAIRMSARLRSEGVVRCQEVKASAATAQGVVDVGRPRDGGLGEGLAGAGVDQGCGGPVLGVAVGAPDEVLQRAHAAPLLTRPVATGSQKIARPTSVSARLGPQCDEFCLTGGRKVTQFCRTGARPPERTSEARYDDARRRGVGRRRASRTTRGRPRAPSWTRPTGPSSRRCSATGASPTGPSPRRSGCPRRPCGAASSACGSRGSCRSWRSPTRCSSASPARP